MHSYREALVVPVIACAYSLSCYLLFHASAPLGATSGCCTSEEIERNKERSHLADKAESSSLISDINESPTKYSSMEATKDPVQLEEGASREMDSRNPGLVVVRIFALVNPLFYSFLCSVCFLAVPLLPLYKGPCRLNSTGLLAFTLCTF